jgi:flavin reductase (DIM6/NTAB) family NADH-FMN oxidoreductase RutF
VHRRHRHRPGGQLLHLGEPRSPAGVGLDRPHLGHLEEAAATFECTVFDELPAGDHFVVLLELHEVYASEHASPLVFHRSQFGRLHGHGVQPRRRATP